MINSAVKKAFQSATIKPVGSTFHLETGRIANRKDYENFAKIVYALRGEWVRKHDAHVFTYDPTEEIAAILESDVLPEVNPYDFFPTPIQEIEEMIDWSDLPRGEWSRERRVLEPQAGDGRIAQMIRESSPKAIIDCYEIDSFNQKILKGLGLNVVGANFLEAKQPSEFYDYILMNPPFNKKEYQVHIKKAWDWLAPKGVLVSIVPSQFRQDKVFRNFVFEYGQAADSHPFETTNVKCSTIKMEKFDTSRFWEPDNCGFDSHYHQNVEVALDSDFIFWDRVKDMTNANKVAEWIDICVERLITKENCNFLYDDRVKAQVLKSILDEREIEPVISDSKGQLALLF